MEDELEHACANLVISTNSSLTSEKISPQKTSIVE